MQSSAVDESWELEGWAPGEAFGDAERVAFRLALEQAVKGDANAMYLLHEYYLEGRGCVANEGHARSWLESAAHLGDLNALFALGSVLAGGRLGAERDLERAAALWQRASTLGHGTASFNLGLLHATGRGVARERTVAAEWFVRAQEQGFPSVSALVELASRAAREGASAAAASNERWFMEQAERVAEASDQAPLPPPFRS